MHIPPQVLCAPPTGSPHRGLAFFSGTVLLRSADYRTVLTELTWQHAYSLAVSGTIEGVATATGKIRYFRELPRRSARTPGP